MKKHKVLHIITRLDKGGSAENTFLTITGLNQINYSVTLLSGPGAPPDQERRRQVEEYGIQYIYIPKLVRNIHFINDLKALIKIYNFLRREKFDIVHTHTSKAGLLGRLAAKIARVPIIIHTPHGHVFFGYFGRFKTKIFMLLEKLASRMTDIIITLTNSEKEDYIKYGIAPEHKLTVINSGVDLNRFMQRASEEAQNFKIELGIPEKSSIVGTVGRLVPVKGLKFLIKAAKLVIQKFPDTFFILAGDGHLKQNLKKQASELGIEKNIIFLGWRDDVARIISTYDIFALPSLNEGMGRVLVEAMALGKPIVASDIGGIPDLVTHERNGFLVPAKNPEQLANYIQILLENEEQREKMGHEGKKIAVNFSKEIMVERIAELYRELMCG